MLKYCGIILALVFFLNPFSTHAYCPEIERYQESSYLSTIAGNILFATFYEEKNGAIEFSIKISNLHPNIEVYEESQDLSIYHDSNRSQPLEYTVGGYESNQTVRFVIYPRNSRCLDDEEMLLVRHVNIPGYNPYYDDPLCKGLSSFLYCQKWHEVSIDYEEFEEKIEEYRRGLEKDDDEDDKDDGRIISLFVLIRENYLHIAGLFGIIIIIFVAKKMLKKDDFGL